jgi:DhnA family fructose-bisphosphate aldolase class Ia
MADHVQEILGYYSSDNAGTKTNIARLLRSGKLAGTGKLVILPVDQGFERAIREGGVFGSIIGRHSFQRPKAHAVKFLQTIMGIYAGEIR